MPVKQRVNAKTLGKRYVQLVQKRDLPVQSVWTRQNGTIAELWVVTEPLSLKELEPVVEAFGELQRQHPDAQFDDHLLNPAWIPEFQEDSHIPEEAMRIELHE